MTTERFSVLIAGCAQHKTADELVEGEQDWQAIIWAMSPSEFETWHARLRRCFAHGDSAQERAACPLCKEDA